MGRKKCSRAVFFHSLVDFVPGLVLSCFHQPPYAVRTVVLSLVVVLVQSLYLVVTI